MGSDDAQLRRPKSGRELVALCLAFLTVAALVQATAFLLNHLAFLESEISKYLIGACFAALPAVFGFYKRALYRRARQPLVDSAAWIESVLGAALLFAVSQLVAVVAALASLAASGSNADAMTRTALVTSAATLVGAALLGTRVARRDSVAPFAYVWR